MMDEETAVRLLVAYDKFLASEDVTVSVDNPNWMWLAEQFHQLRQSMNDEQLELWRHMLYEDAT